MALPQTPRKTLSTLPAPPPPPPWHTHLTLDTITLVLSTTLFHPFLASLLPLCLRAVATPYTAPSFIVTTGFAASVCLYWILVGINRRYAYGPPRKIDWEDEVVVITGGKGGLGGCLAEISALRGVAVAVLDVDVSLNSRGEGVEKEGVVYYYCNVGDSEQVGRVWATVVRDIGIPTVLINNAGVAYGGSFMDARRQDIEATFRTNTLSHFYLNRLFLQPLLSRPTGGTIVTVSSVLGHLGAANLSAYTASKAALLAYHASLAAELAVVAPQIKTVLVAPGQLDTQLFSNVKVQGWLQTFFGPVVSAGEVAVKIVELLDKGEGGEVRLPVYAGWIAWLEILPTGLQRVARKWSGLDDVVGRSSRNGEESAPTDLGDMGKGKTTRPFGGEVNERTFAEEEEEEEEGEEESLSSGSSTDDLAQ